MNCKHPLADCIATDTDYGANEATWWCPDCGAYCVADFDTVTSDEEPGVIAVSPHGVALKKIKEDWRSPKGKT